MSSEKNRLRSLEYGLFGAGVVLGADALLRTFALKQPTIEVNSMSNFIIDIVMKIAPLKPDNPAVYDMMKNYLGTCVKFFINSFYPSDSGSEFAQQYFTPIREGIVSLASLAGAYATSKVRGLRKKSDYWSLKK